MKKLNQYEIVINSKKETENKKYVFKYEGYEIAINQFRVECETESKFLSNMIYKKFNVKIQLFWIIGKERTLEREINISNKVLCKNK